MRDGVEALTSAGNVRVRGVVGGVGRNGGDGAEESDQSELHFEEELAVKKQKIVV